MTGLLAARYLSDASGFTGIVSAFREVGYVEVLRRSENRPIMRYFIRDKAITSSDEHA